MSASSRFRSDPFFKGRLPRSIICLPITTQGVQSGVVLLSTRSEATTETQWIHAKEVVATLATFAVIVTTNVSFTKRLKLEVDERTKELTNALAAKTQFLSQCSHELRSPLSAILVSPSHCDGAYILGPRRCARSQLWTYRGTTRTPSHHLVVRGGPFGAHQQHPRSFPSRVGVGDN